MNKRERSRGASASVVIIAILFLALMGTLGVVFYQNFVQKPQSVKKDTSSETKNQPSSKATYIAFNNIIYAMDYPKDGWQAVAEPGSEASNLTITNKAGTIAVKLSLTRISESLPCNVPDLQIGYYNVSSPTAQQLAGVPLYFVEAINDHQGGGYDYTIGLTPDSGDTHSSVGATICDVAHVGMVATTVYDGAKLRQPAVFARILLPKLDTPGKAAAPDMQTIKNLMNSDDYKAAVKILESARKE